MPRVFCAVDVWHHYAKLTSQAMKVWGANLGTDLRARKGALLGQLQELDDLADGPGLSPDDSIRRNSLDSSLMDIFKSEELFWQRRGGQNWLLKGDANTAYFQGIANGRRRKCAIPFLWDGDALLESLEEISSHINSFYKEMFSAESFGGISLCEDFWPLAKQVSDTENAELTIPFSPEEVGHAIASMKACSAPGPDGLPVIFFQRFWETVHPAIMPMFQEFYIGTLDIGMLNFGVITLIPKVVGASDIRQFRPITVINVVARIFAKVCATRLSPVAERIAHPLQSAFLKGRRIHDGILALHEIVHEVASKALKGVFLKLDFQKAYDRLDWSFLRLVMERRGFDDKWCS
uniref:Reverse transcriptase domain-containing protein n=1 Tax=Hordeum vulgare subsp. vulgare TaxID=112509 RepID=A0A8I6WIN8_HORVV